MNNVIVITVDDLIDVYSYRDAFGVSILTPNIDRLAEMSTQFTNASVPVSLCNPSRAAFASGLSQFETGIFDNSSHYLSDILDASQTMPGLFQSAGYQTVGGGRLFHELYSGDHAAYYDSVFDDYEPVKGFVGTGNGLPGNYGGSPVPESQMQDAKVAEWAAGFIAQAAETEAADPYFMSIGFARPHLSWDVPKAYYDLFSLDDIDVPDDFSMSVLPDYYKQVLYNLEEVQEAVIAQDVWAEMVRAYLAAIAFADAQVGKILDALDAAEAWGETTLMLWSDHGYHLGDKGLWKKFTPYESSISIPFMIYDPAWSLSPEQAAVGVSTLDALPTLLSLAGIEPPRDYIGLDLTRLDDPAYVATRQGVLSSNYGVLSLETAIDGTGYRYILYPSGEQELFDVAADPLNYVNLAYDPAYEAIRAAARAAMEAEAAKVGVHIVEAGAEVFVAEGAAASILAPNATVHGTAGDDVYFIHDDSVVIEAEGGGTDMVIVSNVSLYQMPDHVENLSLTRETSGVVFGNDLNNLMRAAYSDAVILGGAGDDSIIGLYGADRLWGGDGRDRISGGEKSDLIHGDEGDDQLWGENGHDTLYGGDGDDRLWGDAGRDALYGGAGNDTLGSGGENDQLYGGAGNDTLQSWRGDDILDGGEGNDTLDGGLDDDVLYGGRGQDLMIGGGGDDLFRLDDAGDRIVEYADGGFDTLETELSLVLADYSDQVERMIFVGAGDFAGVGNALANTIAGGAGNDRLDGGLGDDLLIGGAGSDSFLDAGGRDRMVGGAGDDRYRIDHAADQIEELEGGGFDTVETTISLDLWAYSQFVETLLYFGTEDFAGAGNARDNTVAGAGGNDALRGGDGQDLLIGLGGNDTLFGGAGADRMIGGAGDDLYRIDDAADQIEEYADEGLDTVETEISLQLWRSSQQVERLVYIGADIFVGAGNARDNTIIGGGRGDEIRGGQGNDSLQGLGGADQLYGGSGDDLLQGGEGWDSLWGEAGDDHLQGGGGDDDLFGGAGDDILDGGLGGDDLFGGTGDDLYRVDSAYDVVTELTGQGLDTIETRLSRSLEAQVERLVFIGAGDFIGFGNGLDNTIIGGAGNDILDGQGGNDRMEGGAGNDLYRLRDIGDQVIEAAGGGIDEIETEISLTLWNYSNNVENLTYVGTGDFVGTGNALDNLIRSGAGADLLRGGQGDDRLLSDAGEDTLFGGSGDDYLGAGGENDQLHGEGGADILLGWRGSDRLYGGAGGDLLDGGEDADWLEGGAGSDRFRFSSSLSGAADVIADFTLGEDLIVLDSSIFSALAAGSPAAGAFQLGAQALQADDRLLYEAGSGLLRYDPDGTGAAAAILFAQLDGAPTLDAGGFLVI